MTDKQRKEPEKTEEPKQAAPGKGDKIVEDLLSEELDSEAVAPEATLFALAADDSDIVHTTAEPELKKVTGEAKKDISKESNSKDSSKKE